MVQPSNSKMLNLSNLIKQYDGVRAVDDVSFKVEKGDIFGFLGPNGAGKTTTIRMIMGIIHQDSGFIELNGKDVNTLGRDNFGYLPEDRGLYQKQKLEETLIYFGILRGLEKPIAKTKANEWLERFGLGDQGNRKIEELSKGNQQKIQFILSLIHDPDLLILDEPFTGLDPLNQLLLKEIIQEKRSDGKTILFSTHQMEQVERSDAVDVRFSGELNSEKAKTYFSDVKIEGASLSGVLSCDPRDFLSWINTCVTVESFQIQVPSLEQIFIEEVKKAS